MTTKLRVNGGSLRGRPLKSPKGSATRPTTALLKKSFFDIITPIIEGSRFLDLFAGSGAIGIEALSRGAAFAAFIESDREALRCIRENLQIFDLEDKSAIFPYDARTALKRLQKQSEVFDLVYADPPYAKGYLYEELLAFFDEGNLLHPGSHLFIEEAKPSHLNPTSLTHLTYKETRGFGKSLLHQYQYKKNI